MSEFSMAEKFGRRLKSKEKYGFSFTQDFEVEGYLRYRAIVSSSVLMPIRTFT